MKNKFWHSFQPTEWENKVLYQLTDWLKYRVEHKYADVKLSKDDKAAAFDDEIENLISVLDHLMDENEPTISGSGE